MDATWEEKYAGYVIRDRGKQVFLCTTGNMAWVVLRKDADRFTKAEALTLCQGPDAGSLVVEDAT